MTPRAREDLPTWLEHLRPAIALLHGTAALCPCTPRRQQLLPWRSEWLAASNVRAPWGTFLVTACPHRHDTVWWCAGSSLYSK